MSTHRITLQHTASHCNTLSHKSCNQSQYFRCLHRAECVCVCVCVCVICVCRCVCVCVWLGVRVCENGWCHWHCLHRAQRERERDSERERERERETERVCVCVRACVCARTIVWKPQYSCMYIDFSLQRELYMHTSVLGSRTHDCVGTQHSCMFIDFSLQREKEESLSLIQVCREKNLDTYNCVGLHAIVRGAPQRSCMHIDFSLCTHTPARGRETQYQHDCSWETEHSCILIDFSLYTHTPARGRATQYQNDCSWELRKFL